MPMRFLCLLVSTILFGAQARVDTAIHGVAYVEVMSSSRTTAVAALRQYRDTSRKDEGLVRVDVFEQVGMPGHFSILETWADQKSFEAHQAAAHTKQMRSKLESIRTSDYDLRPYKSLTAGPARGAANDSALAAPEVDEHIVGVEFQGIQHCIYRGIRHRFIVDAVRMHLLAVDACGVNVQPAFPKCVLKLS